MSGKQNKGQGQGTTSATIGTSANDFLIGTSGSDVIDGKSGADTMQGGLGNDTYVVDNIGDVVIEAPGEGIDTIQSTISLDLSLAAFANVENVTLLGTTSLNATGSAANNLLIGNSAANKLDGGSGADTLQGGTGNDTYVVDNAGDEVVEAAKDGTDTVLSSISYTLGDNLENLTLVGSADINVTGNALNNVLTGNAGANLLDGGAGADTMAGGQGDDVYVIDNAGDVVTEFAGQGTETVQSTIAIDLSLAALANVENVTLLGTKALNATGNAFGNVLTGNAGDNFLNGGGGADTMAGGLGNDTYSVDSVGDVVTEAANAGTDTVRSWIDYTLGSNLENLTLVGSANINATGNALNNVLTGNAGDNFLNGGAGADTMAGGLGNDTYSVDSVGDAVTEAANAGTDTVRSWIGYTLGDNLENLTLVGSANINATGNALNNVLTGNAGASRLAGGDGDDLIIGGVGNDTIDGGMGMDTAAFAGLVGDYQVAAGANGTVIVSALNGTDGTDVLANVELFDFSDGTYQWQNGQLVQAGVTAPTLTVGPATGQEDNSIALNISASIPASSSTTLSLASTSTESLSVVISGVPAGAGLSAGTHNADGSWTLTEAQLSGLSLIPAANYSGTIALTVAAKAYENGVVVAETTESTSVTVDAVADAPNLVTSAASGYANSPIGLDSHIIASLSDGDGSETLSINISGLPQGAALSAGTANLDGTWTLTPGQLAGLTLSPPPNSTQDFMLTVTAVSREANGSTAQVVQTLPVTVADNIPYYVEAMLLPEYNRLNYPADYGTAAVVTFAFLDSVPNYYSSSSWVHNAFSAFSVEQQDATRAILNMISGYTNLTFVETTADKAEMTFGIADIPMATSGLTYYPSYDGVGKVDSDVWIDTNFAADTFQEGSYIYWTLLHEIGHSIGFQHPSSLPMDEYTQQYSVMAGVSHQYMSGEPTTYMPYDIAAMQYLYGVNSQHASGDDIYDFASLDGKIATIWDAGGHDTLDLSTATHGVDVDLRDGHFSTITPSGSDNVAIAFNAVIEDVIGGAYNDTLRGNDVANVINGGQGDDQLTGLAGSDIFDFDAGWGHDVVTDFRPGEDLLDFRGTGASWTDLKITSNGVDTQIAYGDNLVTLPGVATVTQSDLILTV